VGRLPEVQAAPTRSTLPDAPRIAAEADHVGITFHTEHPLRLPLGQLYEESKAGAAWLASRGVRNGDRVGILGPNGPEWVKWAFGSWAAGATVVPIS